MKRISFGQNFEDVVLWRAFEHVNKGRYLDIGAQHPVIDSVSQSFYREGWRGVHVEPTPQYASALRDNRPDEIVIEAAAGDHQGLLSLFVLPDTGLSTGAPEVVDGHRSTGLNPVEIKVPIVSLDALLDHFEGQDLHWLKIDVEGMEASVLRSWKTSSVRPWVIVVEAIDPLTHESNDSVWRNLVEAKNYHETLFDGVNRYFVADEQSYLDTRLQTAANCLDAFYVPKHHWSAAHVVHQCQVEMAAVDQHSKEVSAARDRLELELREASSERDRTASERNHLADRLSDLTAERSVLSNAVGHLRNQLDQTTVHQNELVKLSQVLTAQVETAHRAQVDTELSLSRQASALRDAQAEIRELLEQAQERTARLHAAEVVATLAAHQDRPLLRRAIVLLSRKERRRLLRLRHALSQWKLATDSSSFPFAPPQTTEASVMDIFSFDRRDPYQRATSLTDLCRFSDERFVRCAFVTILGRQPEPNGEAYYLDRLRNGVSKLRIISDLRLSREGQLHDPGIAGLDRALRKHRNANRPLAGWLVRLFTGREGNGPVERSLRELRNQIDAEQHVSAIRAATANHSMMVLDQRLHGIEQQMRAALAGQSASVRHINQNEAAGDTEWANTLHSVLKG